MSKKILPMYVNAKHTKQNITQTYYHSLYYKKYQIVCCSNNNSKKIVLNSVKWFGWGIVYNIYNKTFKSN